MTILTAATPLSNFGAAEVYHAALSNRSIKTSISDKGSVEYSRQLIGRLARVEEEKITNMSFQLSPLLPSKHEFELKTMHRNCLLHTAVNFHTPLGAKGPENPTFYSYAF